MHQLLSKQTPASGACGAFTGLPFEAEAVELPGQGERRNPAYADSRELVCTSLLLVPSPSGTGASLLFGLCAALWLICSGRTPT